MSAEHALHELFALSFPDVEPDLDDRVYAARWRDFEVFFRIGVEALLRMVLTPCGDGWQLRDITDCELVGGAMLS